MSCSNLKVCIHRRRCYLPMTIRHKCNNNVHIKARPTIYRGWLRFLFFCKNIIEKIIENINNIFDELKCGCDPISIYISISSEFCVELTLLPINTQYPQYIIIMELNDWNRWIREYDKTNAFVIWQVFPPRRSLYKSMAL